MSEKGATYGLMRRSKQHLPSTVFDRAGATLREFELSIFSRLALKANTTGHSSVIFQKPPVAFKAQNICVKSPTIQVEFEIKRSSTTT